MDLDCKMVENKVYYLESISKKGIYMTKKNVSMSAFKTIIFILLLTLMWQSLPAMATSISQLEKQDSELKKKLQGINEDIIEMNEEISGIMQQIELTESEIARTQEMLEKSKEDEVIQYENMKLRIRYMYEQGQSSMIEILLGAESLTDFINRSELINSISEYDRNMLDSLVEVSAIIKFEEENLQEQKLALVELNETSKIKQLDLEAQAKATSTNLLKVQREIEDIKEQARIEAEQAAEEALQNQSGSSGSTNNESGSTSTGGSNSYEGSGNDLDVFAAILDCESYANYDYMLGVATVIMNRVKDGRFPGTVSGVIYQSGQFSPTWTGKLNRVLAQGPSSLAYRVAEDAMNGARLDKVSHCYYFLAASSTSRTGVTVGGNLFFVSW